MPGDPFDLSGRVAVVTGAAHGMGRAIALGLARHGADIAACDIDETALAATIDGVVGLGRRGLGVRCDVAQTAEIAGFFAEIDRALGRVDVLVNNVGHVARAKPEELSLDRWQWVMATG